MTNTNSGFQVMFRIGNKTTIRNEYLRVIPDIAKIMTHEEPQCAEDGIGLYAFDLYRENSGKTDISFSEFVNLNLKVVHWTQKKEYPVSISEKVARDSGLFNHRSSFICWVSPEILEKFELVETSLVDTKDKFLRVTLDFDKLVKAWSKAGYPETWKPEPTEK